MLIANIKNLFAKLIVFCYSLGMKEIMQGLTKACKLYNLIEEGDKICVGLSGGKDSLVLLQALKKLQAKIKTKFEICALTIDLSSSKQDWSKITEFCNSLGVEHTIITTDIFEVIFDIRKEKNPCSLCAKMRKGVLYSTAKKMGCNKVAFAHHADDLIETLFMSMLFEGRLNTFHPKIYLSRSDITLIRPLILVPEEYIIKQATNLPIQKNPCPMDKTSKRSEAKKLVEYMSKMAPFGKERLISSIIETERYNLFDKIQNN